VKTNGYGMQWYTTEWTNILLKEIIVIQLINKFLALWALRLREMKRKYEEPLSG
jgi:hypothetical protein